MKSVFTPRSRWPLTVAFALLVALFLPAASAPALAQMIQLRAISFLPQTIDYYNDGLWAFQERVQEALGDRVRIQYLGGPETIAGFEQFDAVGRGVVDLAVIATNYAEPLLPIAPAMELTRLSPVQERKRGVYDFWRGLFEERLNVVYLAQTSYAPHQLWTRFEVKSLDDLRGRIFRSAPMQRPVIEALGASPVSMEGPEIYTAMERGVVDGYGWPTLGTIQMGLPEVTRYRIDPGFFISSVILIANRDRWYSLPEDVRLELEEIARVVEIEQYERTPELIAELDRTLPELGVEIVTLPPDVADEFLELAYESFWDHVLRQDPVLGAELRAMIDVDADAEVE